MSNTVVELRDGSIIAAEINTIKNRTKREILSASIEIGQRLCEAKEFVGHGEWAQWLREKVDYSQSTADNLMRIYNEYGDEQLGLLSGTSKFQTFENLNYSQAVALFALPADERAGFVEDNNVEEMTARQLQEAIKAKEQAEKEKAEAIAAKEKMDSEFNGINKLLAFANESKDKLEKATKKSENEIKKLKDELAATNEPASLSPEELENLRADVKSEIEADYKKQTEQLTLEKKTAEDDKAEIEKKYKEKLKQLKLDNESILERQQAAEKQLAYAAPEVQKISAYCENIQQNLNNVETALSTLVKNGNVEIADKLRGALKKLLNSLTEKL